MLKAQKAASLKRALLEQPKLTPFASLTQSNRLLFSTVNARTCWAFFYRVETKTKISSQISPFTKKFLKSRYAISLFTLTALVLNNFVAIIKVA